MSEYHVDIDRRDSKDVLRASLPRMGTLQDLRACARASIRGRHDMRHVCVFMDMFTGMCAYMHIHNEELLCILYLLADFYIYKKLKI